MTSRRPSTANDTKDRVLVVDDEPVIHELVHEIMAGYEILSAESAAAARAIVSSGERYSVALVDKNLPDVSGLELVRWLRHQRPESEVVIVTAYPSVDSAREAMALGATDYLLKPMRDINELRLRVGNACERVRQRRAEGRLVAALRESEEGYRALFEASPDAMLVIDPETRSVVDANGASERLYGRPRAELVGMQAVALSTEQPPVVIREGVIHRRDRRADGSAVPVEVSTGTVHRDGHPLVIEVVRDVSERERAEAARVELEKRLARAGRLEALGKLAAGVAHDVNNLLCVIRTNAELALLAVGEAHEAAADLGRIEHAVESAADLTRRLLAFSGRQLVRAQVLDINEQVRSVAKLLGRTFEARAQLALELSELPAYVKIDPGQLEQVIANLAVNARDAMPQGGTITIGTRVVVDEPRVCLTVRDTGIGIPEHIHSEIFEPFFTTKGPQGTGLGLATVHEIVTRSGGTIDVRSRVGEGTVFEIRLPWSDEERGEISAVINQPIVGGRGEHVLIVEDDVAVREVTHRLLGRAGYAVHGVGTAEEALAWLARGSANLVIADIDLPGRSGLQLADELDAVAVVLTSGMASDPSRLHGRPFLPKPYSTDDVLRTVRAAIDRFRRRKP